MDFGLSSDAIHKIKGVFTRYEEVEEAVLYGSRAKGNFKPGSDIDLVLRGEKLNLKLLNKISNDLDDLLLPHTFDLSIYHQISNPDLIDHIKGVGRIFYRKKRDRKEG